MPDIDPDLRNRIDDLLFDAVRDSAVRGVSIALVDVDVDDGGATYATDWFYER